MNRSPSIAPAMTLGCLGLPTLLEYRLTRGGEGRHFAGAVEKEQQDASNGVLWIADPC